MQKSSIADTGGLQLAHAALGCTARSWAVVLQVAPTLTHARYSTFARILHTLHHDGFRYRC